MKVMNPFQPDESYLVFLRTRTILVVVLCVLAWIFSQSSVRELFAPPGLTADHAFNATYDSEWTASGSLTLRDGSYSGNSMAEGLESRLQVELESFALGDIDSAGGGDAASILVSTLGSRRQYYEMHVLLEHEGKPVHAGSVFLGDRVKLDCLIIESPGITLRWFSRDAQLGLNGRSPAPESRYFEVRNGRLQQLVR